MFKFELNQVIFYIRENKLHSAPIMSRQIVENLKDAYSANTDLYKRFGKARIEYSTVHGVVEECEAYESKEALAAALIQ